MTQNAQSSSTSARCLLAGALVLTLAACAAPKATEPADVAPRGSPTCVPVEELSQWEPRDNASIELSMPGSSHGYLLRLTRPIEGLMAAENIDIMDADHDGFICPASADGIVVTECDWASAGFASIEPFILPPPTNEL